MTKKVDYEQIKELTGKEIAEKATSGDIALPELEKQEKEDFFKFVKSEPGSQERIDFINARKSPGDVPLDPPASKEPGETPPASIDKPQEKETTIGDGETQKLDEPGKTPPASKDAEINPSELLTQLAKKDEDARKQRNAAAEQGRRRKEAEDRVKELELQIREQAEASKPAEVPKPDKPKRPKVKDFSGDMYSEEYISAVEHYDDAMDVYEQQLDNYKSTGKPEYVKNLEKELTELKAKTNEAYDYTKQESSNIAQGKHDNAWKDVWTKTKEFQNRLGLKTSVDIEAINYYTDIIINRNSVDEAGALKHSESDVSEAQSFINKLPKADTDNYSKAVKIVNKFFDFNGELPRVKYSDLDENSVIDGIIKKNNIQIDNVKRVDLTPAEKADALAKQQKKNDEHVSGMPAGSMGAGDEKLGESLSKDEKRIKLEEMVKTAKKTTGLISPKSHLYDKVFTEKLSKLRFEVLGDAPK